MTISYPEHGHARCRQIEEESFWFRHRNACLQALLRRNPPGSTVYDVGGGNGFVARALQDAGHDVVVVEPGETGCANARALGVERVICAELDSAGIAPASVGAMGLFDVVEHVKDDGGFVQTVRQLLVPGGWLYITVPSYQLLWSATDIEAGHFRRYTRKQLSSQLTDAGFRIEYLSYFFWILPLPILVARSLPWRLGIARRERVAYREHRGGGGPVRRALEATIAWEPGAIESGVTIPFGGSIVVAARREH